MAQTDTVTVGCKLPHGIFMDINVKGQPLQRHKLNGQNSARVVGGFGITNDVPKDLWDRWLSQSKDLEFIKNGFVFALGNVASTESKAKESAKLLNGFEPKDPNALPKGIEAATKA